MSLKEEFTLRNLGFSNSFPQSFCTSQWPIHNGVYVVIQGCLSIYCSVVFISLCATPSDDSVHNIMVYLTVWTYLLLTIHFWWVTVLAVLWSFRIPRSALGLEVHVPNSPAKVHDISSVKENVNKAFDPEDNAGTELHGVNQESQKSKPTGTTLKIMYGMSWILSDICWIVSPIITVVYFVSIYPTMSTEKWGPMEWFDDISVHGINTLFVLTDIMLSARPVRLLHCVYPMVYGTIYGIFTLIYWSVNNNIIYPILDYTNSPGIAVAILFCLLFVAMPLLQLAVFALYTLRLSVRRSFT